VGLRTADARCSAREGIEARRRRRIRRISARTSPPRSNSRGVVQHPVRSEPLRQRGRAGAQAGVWLVALHAALAVCRAAAALCQPARRSTAQCMGRSVGGVAGQSMRCKRSSPSRTSRSTTSTLPSRYPEEHYPLPPEYPCHPCKGPCRFDSILQILGVLRVYLLPRSTRQPRTAARERDGVLRCSGH
jgi:hypothetical protein